MAAGDRRAGQFAKKVAGPAFMRRIAGGEMAGDGKGGYLALGRLDRLADGGFVQRCLLAAVGGMAAGDEEGRVLAKGAGKVGALQRVFVKADHQKRHSPADAFDNGVGGKGGGQRHKADIGGVAVKILENAANGPADPDRQVVARGQRFSGGADGSGSGVEKRRIGVGSACIKPDHKSHGAGPIRDSAAACLGCFAGAGMLPEKGGDPAGYGDALVIVGKCRQRMVHPVRAHRIPPRFHQRGGVVRGEFGMALHAEHIVPDMEHGVGAEGCAADQRGVLGKLYDLVLMDVDQPRGVILRHPRRPVAERQVKHAKTPAVMPFLGAAAKRVGNHLMAETDADKRLVGGMGLADEIHQRRDPAKIIIDPGCRAGDEIAVEIIFMRRQLAIDNGDVRQFEIGRAGAGEHGAEHLRIAIEPVGDGLVDPACF